MRDTHAKFGIFNLAQTPDNGQNSDGGISDFQISGQFLIKQECHNSRTSDDIDMKLGPVIKHEKGNKMTSKKLNMTSCWQVVTTLSFFRFMASLNPEAEFRTHSL